MDTWFSGSSVCIVGQSVWHLSKECAWIHIHIHVLWCVVYMYISFSPYSSPSDPSLTRHNVNHVMEVVSQGRWRDVGRGFSVPRCIRNKIDVECSSHDEKMSAVANYVATNIPGITWETIATVLYQWDEERAVERAKPYLHTVPGGS